MKKPLLFILICLSWAQSSHGQVMIGAAAALEFASVSQGKEILTSRDDFVRRMSPFDRSARMKITREVSEAEYLEFVGQNVLPWEEEEKQKIIAALRSIQPELKRLSLPFPEKVFVIKTSGNEEGGAPYTRSNAIVLPKANLMAPKGSIQKIVCHELFHILSRANPSLREKLYGVIGFVRTNEVTLPPDLRSRKITNPDAPKNDHYILLQVRGGEHRAIPLLFADPPKYDSKRGGEFFDYLQFRFLLVEGGGYSSTIKPTEGKQRPDLLGIEDVSGFWEQVGRNTGYILHPEEILADNFMLMILGVPNQPSPEIIKKMERILRNHP